MSLLLGLAAGGLLGAYWTRPGGWLSFAHGHYYPYYGPSYYAPSYYPYYAPSYYPYYAIPYYPWYPPYYRPY